MSKQRGPYPQAFRDQIVELHRAGRSIMELAREFEPSHHSIRRWVKQAGIDAGSTPVPTKSAI